MTIFAALNLKTKDYEDTNQSFVEVQAGGNDFIIYHLSFVI